MKNNGRIIRSDKTGKSNYTPISNEILRSKTLTCNQKSILVHLLSLPRDWDIYKTTLWKDMNIGRDAFNKAWKGLVEYGYIIENKIYGKNNKIEGYSYIINEEPQVSDSPKSSNPEIQVNQKSDTLENGHTENQLTRNPVSIQKNNITKDILTKEISIKDNIEKNNINTSIYTGPNIGPYTGPVEIDVISEYNQLYQLRENIISRFKDVNSSGNRIFFEIVMKDIKDAGDITGYNITYEEMYKFQSLMDQYWDVIYRMDKYSVEQEDPEEDEFTF